MLGGADRTRSVTGAPSPSTAQRPQKREEILLLGPREIERPDEAVQVRVGSMRHFGKTVTITLAAIRRLEAGV